MSAVTLAQELRDASRMVARVAALGKSLAEQFERLERDKVESSRAALLDLTHGTLRRYGRGQHMVRGLAHRPGTDAEVEALLWCSLYALESQRYADYTVVDQAVRACTLLEKWNAKGYVNAVLRGYLRRREALVAGATANEVARYQHPQWWIDSLREAYPSAWEAVLAAGNSHPPMGLRVNLRRQSAAEYQARLADAGIESKLLFDAALLLGSPVAVDRLPGFDQGAVSVQDAGAQRAGRCLDVADGQRVLDACAAPGGKSAHILERADVSLTSLDIDPARCARMTRNLDRLGLRARVRIADCTRVDEWWDGTAFDRILADVPCTASGIARRHPDLKWLRRLSDIETFALRQAAILDTLWQVLAPGGKLLYVTCSVFARENEEAVEAFGARAQGARRVPLPDGEAAQWLPDAEHDGFYYALIAKQA